MKVLCSLLSKKFCKALSLTLLIISMKNANASGQISLGRTFIMTIDKVSLYGETQDEKECGGDTNSHDEI